MYKYNLRLLGVCENLERHMNTEAWSEIIILPIVALRDISNSNCEIRK